MVEINERAVSRLSSKYGIKPSIQEPRLFWDRVTFDGVNARGLVSPDGNFSNGFKYPVQIRYIMAAMLEDDAYPPSTPVIGDERMTQRYGFRVLDHGSFYMNGDVIPLPLYHNQTTAAPDFVGQSSATWCFDRPFRLATRDSMQIEVSLEFATGTTRTVSATFEGYGEISKVPYIFTGDVSITAADGTNVIAIPADFFKNEGLEPVVICTLTLTCGPDDADTDPTGDIRDLNVSFRQVGYGTNQDWVQGPVTPVAFPRIPAVLCGISQGRCVVHKLPAEGWIWEPGEGVTIQVEQLFTPSRAGEVVLIGMAGHILVT
jgi:hypothetical protein